MRLASFFAAIWGNLNGFAGSFASPSNQKPLSVAPQHDVTAQGVSTAFFASLERMSRLVDITYCVGTTGVSPPFSCASRCSEFPTVELVKTWNTGVLFSDSCGFVALDHGLGQSTQAEFAHAPEIVVAFRGTYSLANTVVDLSTVPQEYVPYPPPSEGDEPQQPCTNCTVHMGFLASWRNAREVVLPALKQARAQHPDYVVHLVGHSLGGAVAALAALELKHALGQKNVKVTTFGEPRIGNHELAAYVNAAFGLDRDGGYGPDLERGSYRERSPYRRVTHRDDPVPLLPLTEWGFRPHAGEVYITKSDLQPAPADLRMCYGDADPECIAGADSSGSVDLLTKLLRGEETEPEVKAWSGKLGFPSRLQLWQLLFAHRDYFWRLGLCVPGGDPSDWGRDRYRFGDEL